MAEKKSDFRLPRPALLKLKAELAKRVLSASVLARVEGLFAQWEADPRVLTDRNGSMVMGDHKLSYEVLIEGRGELDVVEIDGRIRITVDSIYRRLILRMVESYDATGDLKKIKPAPANMLKVRADYIDKSRERARQRAELEAKRKRERERAAAPSKRGRSQTKKPSELSAISAE